MPDERALRIGREIFLLAFGLPAESLDGWVVDRMTAIIEEQTIRTGERILTEGEPPEFLYFVREGEVRFTHAGRPTWILRGRWVIGGYDVLGERPATRTAVAVRDVWALRVAADAWVEVLEDNFQLARFAMTNASRALARLEERIPAGAPTSPRTSSPPPSVGAPATMGLVERLALMLDVRILRYAGVQVLADLAAMSQPVSFAAGDPVLPPGGQREDFVLISDGQVFAQRTGPTVERLYGPGDLVCGAAMLGGVAGDWEARALSPVCGVSFPRTGLFDLMEEHFDLVRSAFAALGARRELLLDHLAVLSGGELVLT
jgi:CRP-like cAMP-binding protein